MKVGLFISKDQHISLLQAPTPFLCPIFSLFPLSIHLSLSYSLANGKTVLGCILFFKGFNSPLYTLDLTLWQALSVSSAWYRGLVFCVLMDTAHYHTQVQAHTHTLSLFYTHTKNALVHMSMHAHKHQLMDIPHICIHTIARQYHSQLVLYWYLVGNPLTSLLGGPFFCQNWMLWNSFSSVRTGQ